MAVVCCDWLISFSTFSSDVRLFVAHRWLWCFLIVGIQAFGISAPLSLFMLLGLSLMRIAFFTFLVYQCFLCQQTSLLSIAACVLFRWRVLRGWNSGFERIVYIYHVLLSSFVSVIPFPQCRLFRILVDYSILLVWVSGIFRFDQLRP